MAEKLLHYKLEGLQIVLQICTIFAILNDIVDFCNKTVCMTFRQWSSNSVLEFSVIDKNLSYSDRRTLNDEGFICTEWKKFNAVGNFLVRKFVSCLM